MLIIKLRTQYPVKRCRAAEPRRVATPERRAKRKRHLPGALLPPTERSPQRVRSLCLIYQCTGWNFQIVPRGIVPTMYKKKKMSLNFIKIG